MEKAKFEKIEEEKKVEKQKKDGKEEIKLIKEEIKQKKDRLLQIPVDNGKNNQLYNNMVTGLAIKKNYLNLWLKDLRPIKPKYQIETSLEWINNRKEELEHELRGLDELIKQRKEQLALLIKENNEQESRIKEDLPRLNKKLKELEEESKTTPTK